MATVDRVADRGTGAAPERPPLPAVPLFFPFDSRRPHAGHRGPIGRAGAGESDLVALMAEGMRRRAPAEPAAEAGGPSDGH